MINGARGEVGVEIDGRTARLCLTLGALAEIETALGCSGIAEIGRRLSRLSAGDLLIVLAALLRGGGEDALAARIFAAPVEAGAAMRAVAAAFSGALSGEA